MRIRANIWHLIGRLNQPASDGFLSLRACKPSSSEIPDRGRSIIQAIVKWDNFDYTQVNDKWDCIFFPYLSFIRAYILVGSFCTYL
jgi:hypothetical protein